MTESEARAKPISEVWAEMQMASKHVNDSNDWETADYLGSVRRIVKAKYEHWKPYLDVLRAVLLERCFQIWDADGVDTQITIFKTPLMDCIRVDQGKYVRYDNYETCLNMSAAYAFWAWELKQRNAESNGR